jgi:hypothetical protein
VAIRLRYERSSLLIAALKLWRKRPSAGDLQKFSSFLYKRDGSARVWRMDIIGKGKVGGNLSVPGLEKGRVVDDRP